MLERASLIRTLARLRPGDNLSRPLAATRAALRRLARRHQALDEEIAELDAEISPLVKQAAPQLLELFGVGPETAGQLLAPAGDNPERMRSEAAFAHLAGVAPIPASSGRTHRHRLNRGGDRAANNALHTIVLTRMRFDERTRAYVAGPGYPPGRSCDVTSAAVSSAWTAVRTWSATASGVEVSSLPSRCKKCQAVDQGPHRGRQRLRVDTGKGAPDEVADVCGNGGGRVAPFVAARVAGLHEHHPEQCRVVECEPDVGDGDGGEVVGRRASRVRDAPRRDTRRVRDSPPRRPRRRAPRGPRSGGRGPWRRHRPAAPPPAATARHCHPPPATPAPPVRTRPADRGSP
ncbi:hypothetical protein GCM10009578_055980 [Streptomyces rhizosphaericus]